MICKITQ